MLYLLIFISRYLNLFTTFISFYNAGLKIAYLVQSVCLVVGIYYNVKKRKTLEADSFKIYILLVPTAILSRQVAVIRETTDHAALILNLPGQPKSIKETLEGLKDAAVQQIVSGIFVYSLKRKVAGTRYAYAALWKGSVLGQ